MQAPPTKKGSEGPVQRRRKQGPIYKESKVFETYELNLLQEFDDYLDSLSELVDDFFLDYKELEDNPKWDEIREKATCVLEGITDKKYKIEVAKVIRYSCGILIEEISTNLIEED